MKNQQKSQTLMYRAAYLTERKKHHLLKLTNEQEIKKWKEILGDTKSIFENRIARDNLNQDEFFSIVANKDRPILKKNPQWIQQLHHILENYSTKTDDNEIEYSVFKPFFIPFLKFAKYNILNRLKKMHIPYNSVNIAKVSNSILRSLHMKLESLSIRALISELHIARLTNKLKGDTPEQRFNYFVQTYLGDNKSILELLKIYPVLARLIIETIDRRINSFMEAIQHFLNDREKIKNIFSNYDFSHLVKIEANAGDAHNSGRSVMIFIFDSGDKLAYKPRPLTIDKHFKHLIFWINQKGFSHPLTSPRIIDRESYGWQEYIEYRSCKTEKDLRNFYYRQGGYIALLYLMHSTDFHAENLIACGEQPVLIDLETLFGNQYNLIKNSDFDHKTTEELSNSVFSSMMLPVKFSNNPLIDLDLSGIGGVEGQKSKKIEMFALEHKETDQMRLKKVPVISGAYNNRPKLKGKEIDPVKFIKEIENGFEEMYNLFLSNRNELLSSSGPIYKFANVSVRHVVRPTYVYGKFLEAGTHPDYLKNGLQRVKLFDHLWQVTSYVPKFLDIVASECKDLLNDDIPYFSFKFNGTSIFDSGKREIHNFYKKSALQLVIERCKYLNPEDCFKQLKYIRMSLMTLLENPFRRQRQRKPFHISYDDTTLDRKLILKEAKKIGDHFLRSAIWDHNYGEAYWIGLSFGADDKLSVSPLSLSLYDGALGIILFLSYLGVESREKKYIRLAKAGLNGILRNGITPAPTISSFYGYMSVTYTLANIGLLLNDKNIFKESYSYIKKSSSLIKKDLNYDFIGGVAGALLVLLRIYEINKDSSLIIMAEKCGDHLLKYVNKRMRSKEKYPLLSGLSHGAAGYAWALIELSFITKQYKYKTVGEQILQYERALFNNKEKNWIDVRNHIKAEESPVYWCYGAPGIGIGRLMLSRYHEDKKIESELWTAIEKTLEYGFGDNQCLCHGDFGNLDFILLSAQHLKSQSLKEKSKEIGFRILRKGQKEGWHYGMHESIELEGLMLGLAGIGYGLLRLWNPSIPSVLALQLHNLRRGV